MKIEDLLFEMAGKLTPARKKQLAAARAKAKESNVSYERPPQRKKRGSGKAATAKKATKVKPPSVQTRQNTKGLSLKGFVQDLFKEVGEHNKEMKVKNNGGYHASYGFIDVYDSSYGNTEEKFLKLFNEAIADASLVSPDEYYEIFKKAYLLSDYFKFDVTYQPSSRTDYEIVEEQNKFLKRLADKYRFIKSTISEIKEPNIRANLIGGGGIKFFPTQEQINEMITNDMITYGSSNVKVDSNIKNKIIKELQEIAREFDGEKSSDYRYSWDATVSGSKPTKLEINLTFRRDNMIGAFLGNKSIIQRINDSLKKVASKYNDFNPKLYLLGTKKSDYEQYPDYEYDDDEHDVGYSDHEQMIGASISFNTI